MKKQRFTRVAMSGAGSSTSSTNPTTGTRKKTVDLPDGVSYEVTPIGAALFSDLAPLGDDRLYLSVDGESLVCVFSSDVVTVICPAF